MKSWSCAALLSAALVLAGCGPRIGPDELVDARATGSSEPTLVSDGGAASPSAPMADPTVTAAATAAPGSKASDAPAAEASPDYGTRHNNGVVRIELSATCVQPGDILVITFRAPPKAGLGMVIGYSDNQAHGAMLTGESDANGVYVWRVPVELTVPDGEAKVLVTSTGPNWEQGSGGSADKSFRVSRGDC